MSPVRPAPGAARITPPPSAPGDRERAEHVRTLLATVLDSTADPIHAKLADGRYVLVNRRAAAIIGQPESALLGLRVSDLGSGEVAERSQAEDAEVMASGRAIDREWQVQVDGELRTFDVRKAPWRDEDGVVIGVVTVARDVTERRAAEARAYALERQRAMGMLAAGVAHDLRNLLQVAMARVTLASELGAGAAALPHLEGATAALEAAADLSRRLGALGGRPARRGRVHLSRVLTHCLDAVAARATDVRLVTALPQGLPRVEGDDVELGRAFLNLLENALEALAGGGDLRVETRTEPGWVVAEVADTGVGMDEPTLARAFEPFFTTKAARGTGLGLAVVQRVVADHDGKIDVWSRPGEGTRFTVRLPLRDPPASA